MGKLVIGALAAGLLVGGQAFAQSSADSSHDTTGLDVDANSQPGVLSPAQAPFEPDLFSSDVSDSTTDFGNHTDSDQPVGTAPSGTMDGDTGLNIEPNPPPPSAEEMNQPGQMRPPPQEAEPGQPGNKSELPELGVPSPGVVGPETTPSGPSLPPPP